MASSRSRYDQDREIRTGQRPQQLPSLAPPLVMLGLLGAQFLLGMAVNLFVQLPPSGEAMATMMSGNPLIPLHMMLGILLGAGAVLAVVLARAGGTAVIGCAALALGGIVVAGSGGLTFLFGSYDNTFSFLMSVGFLVAVGGYVGEFAYLRRSSAIPG